MIKSLTKKRRGLKESNTSKIQSKSIKINNVSSKPQRKIAITSKAEPVIEDKREIRTIKNRLAKEDRYLVSKLDKADISAIRLSVLSTEYIMDVAIGQISIPDASRNIIGGVNDPRLGPIDSDSICTSCNLDMQHCASHIGFIKLPEPIINPSYRRTVANILTSVCQCCARLILDKETIDNIDYEGKLGIDRITKIAEKSMNLTCNKNHKGLKNVSKCTRNPIFDFPKVKETGQLILKSPAAVMSITKALEILKQIPKEDIELLGLMDAAHPKDFIMEVYPVISPMYRQSTWVNSLEQDEHITTTYIEILKKITAYESLEKDKKNQEIRSSLMADITAAIVKLIDDKEKTKGFFAAKNQIINSLKKRMQGGKDNIMRSLMLGKRVNFAGRTVITGDPTLAIDQIGIPISLAKILTKPQRVSSSNIVYLTAMYLTGRVKTVNRRLVDIIDPERKLGLKIGDYVDRWLDNDDYVIINRQPTLSSDSIQAGRVRLHAGDTITLPPGLTTPFNADFDGDEMNMHVLQTEEADREAATLLNIKNCFVSFKDGKNSITVIQDAMIGLFKLTADRTILLSRERYLDILTGLSIMNSDLNNNVTIESLNKRLEKFGINPKSGYGIFSSVLPEDLSFESDNVRIFNGVLVSGNITKSIVGQLIANINRQYGVNRNAMFIDDLYSVGGQYMMEEGFSIGIKDCLLDKKDPIYSDEVMKFLNTYRHKFNVSDDKIIAAYNLVKESGDWDEDIDFNIEQMQFIMSHESFKVNHSNPEIQKAIQKAYMEVENFGGVRDNPIEEERREKQIQARLAEAKGYGKALTGKILPESNALNILAWSGAKGGVTNTSYITAELGQQYLESGRPPNQISKSTRTLPHFDQESPDSRGYINTSYFQGLSPTQYFFALEASREGLLGTATQTSETGTIQRKMNRNLENLVIANDGSVRFGNRIIQFAYGNHGFDISKLEKIKINISSIPFFINIKNLANNYNVHHNYFSDNYVTFLPYEQILHINNRQALIINQSIFKIQIQYQDNQEIQQLEIDSINKDDIEYLNILPARKYYSQSILTLIPIYSNINIKITPLEISAIYEKYEDGFIYINSKPYLSSFVKEKDFHIGDTIHIHQTYRPAQVLKYTEKTATLKYTDIPNNSEEFTIPITKINFDDASYLISL